MKGALLILVILAGSLGCLNAEDPLIQAAIANNQLLILNRLSSIQHPPAATNNLQKISLNEIMTALDQGYTSKEIFERAQRTNDPRLPAYNQLGDYKINAAIKDFLSPMNSNAIAAQTAPTPEPVEDIRVRMENEAQMRKYESNTVSDSHATQEKQEMQKIYEQVERLETRAKSKVQRELK